MPCRILPNVLAALMLIGCLDESATMGQQIVQKKGADPKVDYASLVKYGPWDDRNYELTAADLKLLAPNEEELVSPLPAFFRVRMRKESPTLQKEGPAQYPRSATQIFFNQFGGYLIDGKLYKRTELQKGRYVIVLKDGVEYKKPVRDDKKAP